MSIRDDANECARRWISCNDRRVKKGKPLLLVTIEDMQDFADGIAESNISDVAELAYEKVLEWERRVALP